MLVIRTLSRGLVVLAAITLCTSVHAQEINDSTKEQLHQLKEICESGLVGPEICKEKQKDILGLRDATQLLLEGAQKLQSSLQPVVVQPYDSTPAGLENRVQQSQRLSVMLPPGWTKFTTEELTAGRQALLQRLGEDPKAKGLLKLLKTSTASAADAHFRNDGDVLQIGRFSPSLVLDPARAEKTCQALSKQVAAVAQANDRQNTELLDCGMRQIGGFPALYVEKNSIRDEVRVIQLWVAKSPEETFHFFLRCKADRITTRKKELEDIVASVQWQ